MILGIGGGTGSGKTTFAEALVDALGESNTLLLAQDCYYKDSSHLPHEERARLNFDHPDSVDFELLAEHLEALERNERVQRPCYNFAEHVRCEPAVLVLPKPVILVEGILIFQNQRVRELLKLKIFVDSEPDIRFIRRLKRDLRDRGRTLDSVVSQYLATVRPMHVEFVESSKRFADIIVPEGGRNPAAVEQVTKWVAIQQAIHKSENA